MFYLAYLGVTVPMLVRRPARTWPKPITGHTSRSALGLPSTSRPWPYGSLVAINIAWPAQLDLQRRRQAHCTGSGRRSCSSARS